MFEKTDETNEALEGIYRITEIDQEDAWHAKREGIMGKEGTIIYVESNDKEDESLPADTHAFWFIQTNRAPHFFAAAKFEKVED